MSNKIIFSILFVITLLCLTSIAVSWIFIAGPNSGRRLPIGGSVDSTTDVPYSIKVTGKHESVVTPDMGTIWINATELKPVVKEAQDAVNVKVASVLTILKEAGISKEDIQTQNISVYPEYDYPIISGQSSAPTLKGQRATQALSVKVKGIDKDKEKAGKIIDALSKIEGIQFSGISFDVSNRDQLVDDARKEAIKKASKKADDLASAGGFKKGKVISVTDGSQDSYPRPFLGVADSKDAMSTPPTQVSSGSLTITSDVTVTYEIL